jgi:Na+/melibiose symporter-like transporter
VDRVQFKKGKFVPWLRISLVAIPLATIFLFAMQPGMALGLKIFWATLGYVLWDAAYTICDVPIFGLVTTITDNLQERTVFISIGRVLGIAAAIIVSVAIGNIREALGGWLGTTVVLSVIGLITMIPICFTAKERFTPPPSETEVGLKEMFKFISKNKYILIFYSAIIIWGGLMISNALGMYIARYNLGNEGLVTAQTLITIFPMMVVSMFVPALTKRFDKFNIFFCCMVIYIALSIVSYFVGYSNLTAYLVMLAIKSIAYSGVFSLLFLFTPDCAEYGRYKSGISAPGISFSIQTFSVKMMGALGTAAAAAALGIIGFVEGAGAEQLSGFADKLWFIYIIIPAIGGIIVLPILKQYKLRDKYVKIMTDCNNGVISRDEAEKQLAGKV